MYIYYILPRDDGSFGLIDPVCSMQAAAVADARSLSNAHAEELRLIRETLKKAEEAAAVQKQARTACHANILPSAFLGPLV